MPQPHHNVFEVRTQTGPPNDVMLAGAPALTANTRASSGRANGPANTKDRT